jgi:hypothetical protein
MISPVYSVSSVVKILFAFDRTSAGGKLIPSEYSVSPVVKF